MAHSTNLNVTGIAAQTLYNQYLKNEIIVNRKYQRKLVWTIEEKAKFIDSILQDFPVPLILTAEIKGGVEIEIIDGLQRLNAVFSFMDGDYSINGKYFDPDTLAETRTLAIEDESTSKEFLERELCWKIASYVLPISTYRAENEHDIEEIFRRINSNGRHLSKQEIRQAGSLVPVANLVRKISASIRNDFSVGDRVNLKNMQSISLTDSPDSIGIQLNKTFWIRHGILRKEQVRESRDEEVVLDLLISMVQGCNQPYRSDIFDEYYNSDKESPRRDAFNAKISQYPDPIDYFIARFRKNIDVFEKIFIDDLGNFSNHFFTENKSRVPRYFESVLLAIDSLYFGKEPFEINDWEKARNKLKGIGTRNLDIPGGGGSWTGDSKVANVDLILGILRQCSEPSRGVDNPLLEQSHLEVQNLLQASQVEEQLFELKQGFCTLSKPPTINNGIVEEIGKTLTAMANKSKIAKGYLIVGIVDKPSASDRIKEITNEENFPKIENREICGLDLDIRLHGDFEKLYMWFSNKFKDLPILPTSFKDQVLNDMKTVKIGNKTLLLLKARGMDEPISYNGKFYTRNGSRTDEINPSNYKYLFDKFSD